MKYFKTLFVSILLFSSLAAEATVVDFGTLLSGSYTPSSNFASLTVTGSGDQYTFTLKADDLNALFTNGAFIGRIAVDTTPDISLTGKGATSLSITNISGGVTNLTASNAGGPTGVWDFSFNLGQGAADRLTANETVSWTATFSQNVTFSDYAIHVQGLTTSQGSSAWYTPSVTPVPEPETYGMMALGLGLIGFIARRRNQLL